jgi:hypothetical protein
VMKGIGRGRNEAGYLYSFAQSLNVPTSSRMLQLSGSVERYQDRRIGASKPTAKIVNPLLQYIGRRDARTQ